MSLIKHGGLLLTLPLFLVHSVFFMVPLMGEKFKVQLGAFSAPQKTKNSYNVVVLFLHYVYSEVLIIIY